MPINRSALGAIIESCAIRTFFFQIHLAAIYRSSFSLKKKPFFKKKETGCAALYEHPFGRLGGGSLYVDCKRKQKIEPERRGQFKKVKVSVPIVMIVNLNPLI